MTIENEKGQSFFELVVAIAISALVIVAIVSLTTDSIRNSNYSKNKSRAATYAQETSEWLRGKRDSDIEKFIEDSTTPYWCLQNLDSPVQAVNPSECTGKIPGTIFNRWLNLTTSLQSGKTVVEAVVVVSWKDSQGTHEVRSATNLTDWRER